MGGVTGVPDEETAWRAFQETVLKDLHFVEIPVK
jgi:hypothetical protein